ncbi:hypothetical protein FHT02_004050 [Sphingomonas xinjiangensis]|uniref:Uncharacterized protein n=1 Tax=Sphingomonas xinjiangensis TaxID=643568 RepID=A0A840YSW3_9SPHN|nr:hypothetical protein [Sphingomonas xinjiangensis]
MEFAMLATSLLGYVAGVGLRRLTSALVLAGIVGFGMAIAYHVWLNADPSRGDALEGLGYFAAVAYPLTGCTLGRLKSRPKRKPE